MLAFHHSLFSDLTLLVPNYSSIVYLGLKNDAAKLLSSTNPKVKVRFPLRSEYKSSSSTAKKVTSKTTEAEGGWMSKKKKKSPKVTRTKTSTSNNKKKTPRGNSKGRKSSGSFGTSNLEENTLQPEVIDILDDSDEELISKKRPSRLSAISASKKIRSAGADYLFDSDSSENEF